MAKRAIGVVVVFLLLTLVSASAQDLSKRLTNKDVIDMVSLGLSEDVILEKIRTSKDAEFDTSIQALKALKEAKVPDAVIKLMVNPKAGAPTPAAAAVADDPNLPPKEVGIYWRDKEKFVMLDSQMIGQAKMGGRWASSMTMGFKAKHWNAYITGSTSKIRVLEARPVFYVYVMEGSSANDFSLLKLDKKDDRRQFEVGSVGGLVGGKSGVRDEKMIPFDAERVAPRTYKLTLKADLKQGEYGFFMATGQNIGTNGSETAGNTNGRIFDFSVPE